MNTKIGIISFVVVILLLLGIGYIFVSGNSDFFETSWDDDSDNAGGTSNNSSLDGTWGAEILISFTDGTNENLKSVIDSSGQLSFFSQPLSVKYENKDVESFTYSLYGKGSGDGYTETTIDLSDFQIDFELRSSYTNNIVNTVGSSGSGTVTLALDDDWHEVFTVTMDADSVCPDSVSEKTYIVDLMPSGSISFDGGTGSYIDADLPEMVRFIIQKTDENYINIEFESGYKTY